MTAHKLTDEEKKTILECVEQGVKFIKRRLDGVKLKNPSVDYTVPIETIAEYINEFAELCKNNEKPMITTLHNEYITNLEKRIGEIVIEKQKLNDVEKRKGELIDKMNKTDDKKLYLELRQEYDNITISDDEDHWNEDDDDIHFFGFTNMYITSMRDDCEYGFHRFFAKNKKMRKLMKEIGNQKQQ